MPNSNGIESKVSHAYTCGMLTMMVGIIWLQLVIMAVVILTSPTGNPINLVIDFRYEVTSSSKLVAAGALLICGLLGSVIFRRPKTDSF